MYLNKDENKKYRQGFKLKNKNLHLHIRTAHLLWDLWDPFIFPFSFVAKLKNTQDNIWALNE